MTDPVFQFLNFELTAQELVRDGTRIELDPTPHAALYFLARHAGHVVSRQELQTAVWGRTFVSLDTVTRTVGRARAALGDLGKQPRVIQVLPKIGFKFIADVRKVPRPIFPGDRSRFIRDVNFPDGTVVGVNECFDKKWEIENAGSVVWADRFMTRQGPANDALRLQSPERVAIPRTRPGERVIISIPLQAPSTPGSCEARWKMTDAEGRLLLPNQSHIHVSVDVEYKPDRVGNS